MNVKQLKEELSKLPEEKEVYVSNQSLAFLFPITGIIEGWSMADDPIVIIES